MCSHFLKRMENYQQGDLTDILRASGGSKTAAEEAAAAALADWQFPAANNTVDNNINNYPTDDPVDVFGDPFSSHMGDPLLLLHGINAAATAVPASGLFLHSSSEETGNSSSSTVGFTSIDGLKRPNNMFSRMLQIAPNPKLPLPPCDSPAAESPRGLVKAPPDNNTLIISPNSSKLGCLLESPGNLQISSPRNTGIRRRKSQAKKVVCIPAPAPANSRSSGEIVPSDLWAWRKYGQKPIKGSPYPRGYYRCSSSKGCSARKQVERSRTDPNMLVITYTSEHNHPWPTQRNALAGSTRSQPSSSSKNINPSSSSSQKSTRSNHLQKHNHHHQEEHKLLEEESSTRGGGGGDDTTAVGGGGAVKEEEMEQDSDDHHHLEFDDNNQGFSHIYRPTLPDAAHHSEDSFLFADLGEIETDSLDILLKQGFSGEDDGPDSKSLDPFTFYDWASTGNNNNMISTTTTSSPATAAAGAATTTTSYGEPANKNNDHP
ncbi:hypothetical protein ABFS82_13G184400 [Erythranthe guttata]|uniref:probable WRKY transcription factor 14 n=1 Tax=Erythranthe guttata TaxID=4155 RepID=UPI00064D9DE6|nr:PREDICTED: probable WRKY transcription factor 14 [Erythranthe guttata]|eukprot:XP_012827414.1 PREDICTED: probable WRKY transcription factor 14 [Erythranthe guttata]